MNLKTKYFRDIIETGYKNQIYISLTPNIFLVQTKNPLNLNSRNYSYTHCSKIMF